MFQHFFLFMTQTSFFFVTDSNSHTRLTVWTCWSLLYIFFSVSFYVWSFFFCKQSKYLSLFCFNRNSVLGMWFLIFAQTILSYLDRRYTSPNACFLCNKSDKKCTDIKNLTQCNFHGITHFNCSAYFILFNWIVTWFLGPLNANRGIRLIQIYMKKGYFFHNQALYVGNVNRVSNSCKTSLKGMSKTGLKCMIVCVQSHIGPLKIVLCATFV